MQKLILGTAQFSQKPYGIKGDPVPNEKEIEKIARTAWDGGIRVIHTSWQYNLPKICEAIFSEFEKIEKDKDDPLYAKWKDQIYISSYGDESWDGFVNGFIVPVNILDHRFINNVIPIPNLIARSVFLQGLLLMDFGKFPEWLKEYPSGLVNILRFRNTCLVENFQPYEAALGWVLGLKDVDYVIVGVNSAEQLEQLLEVKPLQWDYDFSITDENVLDPRRWPKA